MIDLLKTSILNHVNETRPGNLNDPFPNEPMVEFEMITDAGFDIVDTKGIGGSIKRPVGEGTATYFNGTPDATHNLCFIKNEEYFNQFNILGIGDWAKGRSRPDYVVYTPDKPDYFIVHELSEGEVRSKLHKAVIQILNYLRFLSDNPESKTFIGLFDKRLCYVSAKGCVAVPTPDGIADGFMDIYSLLPDPQPIHNKSIEKMGFSAYATNVVRLL